MRLRNVFIYGLLAICPVTTSLDAAKLPQMSKNLSARPEGPKIRVLLEKDAKTTLIEARGKYSVIDQDTEEKLSSGSVGKRFIVHALRNGLRWGEEYPGSNRITIVPENSSTMMYVNGIQYKGAISVYHSQDNLVTVVNDIPLEDYLKSTLALNNLPSLTKEAAAACVIAARTNAFAHMKSYASSKRYWDVVGSEVGYYGYAVTAKNNALEDIIDLTRFIVLESQKGEGMLQEVAIAPEDAEQLAERGLDAKKILLATYPEGKIALTTPLKTPKSDIR